ncbi:epoxide hydrolase [Jiangella ureilytica]|uniref:Epoxide hydrolase n=1 Tax=Jiangella ureilytica TaxID=2530374 RepID=A0A4R4RXA4_9ACTN|nr:epoxide hydrolase [Jiangella ureilytica]TDC54406.1 epoxide hydrolase [Jiangella ureilytica]
MEPFRIDVPRSQLDDLRDRLRATRWPEPATVDDWSQGVPLGYVRDLCDYWATAYDWRRAEGWLNGLPQYRTEVDGLGIHLLHVRSPHADAFPLVMTHGWPGSTLEFRKVVGPLTDPVAYGGSPADAFHVVVPSLPGYGFSDKPGRSGWGVERIAAAWATIMDRLGYRRYGAQGSDWGTTVSTLLGVAHPDRVAGIHLMPPLAPPDPATFDSLTDAERSALDSLREADEWGSGYSRQQATRPQTVGYGLVDSPAALCAWIAEKYWFWTDHEGSLDPVVSRDELLDTVMLYWLPAAGASAARLYWESIRQVDEWISSSSGVAVDVPTGCTVFPKELQRPSRRWAERRFTNIVHWGEPARGGHFAALEQPGLFVDEVRSFFRLVR